MRLIVMVTPLQLCFQRTRAIQSILDHCKRFGAFVILTMVSKRNHMDLGIRGRTAIVCASSQGLGKACAHPLAQAGVSLVINGRNRTLLDQTAEQIRQATGAEVTPVVADVSTVERQEALLAARPAALLLINNNGRAPSLHVPL